MIKKSAGILALLLPLYISAVAMTDAPEVRASLKPDTVLIGDRFSVEVFVDKDMMQVVSFPVFEGSMMGDGIEILSESCLDTVKQDGRRQLLHKRYELTAFEAGAYDLGRYPVLYSDKNITDTLYSSEPLRIVVNTFPVDTEQSDVYDIKSPLNTPLLVSEFAGYVLGGTAAGLVLAALILLFIRTISKRRRKIDDEGVPQPSVPPHVRAIQELETLHNQKLWQSGKTKAYYTKLTDILREYLSGRYGLAAMEMTSDEIMQACEPLDIPRKECDNLRTILLTADLVKFAKYVPGEDANENLYYAAYYFIEDTKEPTPEQVPEDDESANDEK